MDFSTFRILPLSGKIAWKFLSLPPLAVPPAESPSTRKISLIDGSLDEQSANFPGKPDPPNGDFLCTISRAFFAA